MWWEGPCWHQASKNLGIGGPDGRGKFGLPISSVSTSYGFAHGTDQLERLARVELR